MDSNIRNFAAEAIQKYLDGKTKPEDLEKKYSSDRNDIATIEIFHWLMLWFGDLRTGDFPKPELLNKEDKAIFQRAILFLNTDMTYRFTSADGLFMKMMKRLFSIISFGKFKPLKWDYDNSLTFEFWPFSSKEEYERTVVNFK